MSIALRNQQKLVLIVLAFLTVLVIGLVTLSTVAHIDVWHLLLSLGPDVMYGNG